MAHRQGFRDLNHVKTCVLEPGGTFFIEGKESAAPATTRELTVEASELMRRLDSITDQLAEIRRELETRR